MPLFLDEGKSKRDQTETHQTQNCQEWNLGAKEDQEGENYATYQEHEGVNQGTIVLLIAL